MLRLFLIFLLFVSANVQAGIFDSILLPGDLVSGHAKFQDNCKKCHLRFDKTGQRQLCLDCHKLVRADVEKKEGFHGRIPGIRKRECNSCHGEHQGRKADIVHLDSAAFDHQQTDFKLKGQHLNLACKSCHKDSKPKRKTPSRCISCHKKQDVHKGKLGKKCQRCHGESGWAKISGFDHDKTDFPLRHAHKKATCRSCHPDGRFVKVAGRCVSCHKVNDKHRGQFGPKCGDCHSERAWKKIKFNHDKDTKYRLRGRHAKVSCTACHDGKLYKQKLKTKCIACHEGEDRHKGSYGRKCADCHQLTGWQKTHFRHDRDTDYPLFGRHKKVHCVACHTGENIYDDLDTQCRSCHAHDDIHQGELGKNCNQCHDPDGWNKVIVFDHDLSRFPLLGLHTLASCEDCHVDQSYRGTERVCGSCHEGDDVHEKRLGSRCGLCHTANGWRVWSFDHDKQTDFRLRGAHGRLECKRCHRQEMTDEVLVPKACYGCHRGDDIHRGNFGRHCERCHGEDDFSKVEIRRR